MVKCSTCGVLRTACVGKKPSPWVRKEKRSRQQRSSNKTGQSNQRRPVGEGVLVWNFRRNRCRILERNCAYLTAVIYNSKLACPTHCLLLVTTALLILGTQVEDRGAQLSSRHLIGVTICLFLHHRVSRI